MGRKKPLTGRKKTLQLAESKRLEGSPLSGKGIYAQPTSTGEDATVPNAPASPGQSSEDQNTPGMDGKLADFMKAIDTLGSRDDIEAPSSGNPTQETDDTQPEGEQHSQDPQNSSQDAPLTFWRQVVDANSNHPYYWNPLTNEVSWVLPSGGVLSYDGVYGGDEQGEPLDYFAYYDQGLATKEEVERERAKMKAAAGEGKAAAEVGGKAEGGAPSGQSSVKSGTGSEGKEQPKESLSEAGKLEDAETVGGVLQGDATSSAQDFSHTVSDRNNPVSDPSMNAESSVGGDESVAMVTSPSGEDSWRGGANKRKLEHDEDVGSDLQLTPTSRLLSGIVSPPKKMSRSSRPHGRVMEEKTRKTRSTPTPSSAKQEQQALRFQVSSLADELSRKLQFLHVSTDGIADMQVLQIQVKTRIVDWEEGGLDTKFLLTKLKEASEDLLSYEQQAAPKGWRFLWDSTTCRYRFQHISTGEISWGYPTGPLASEGDSESSDSSNEEQEDDDEEQVESSSLLPTLPPTQPPPPPPQSTKPVKQVSQTSSNTQKPTQIQVPPDLPQKATPTSTKAISPVTKKPASGKSPALPAQVMRSLIRETAPERSLSQSKGKDLATPTAAFLRGGEMVPAPLPRAWKYENDELNRRVRREGSIERREEVAEHELSPSDVRRKLSKRSLPALQSRGRTDAKSTPAKEQVDLSDLPPSPPSSPPSPVPAPSTSQLVPTPQPKEPAPVVVATPPKEATPPISKEEIRGTGDVVKEALRTLSLQLRGEEVVPEKSKQRSRDHGSREGPSVQVPPAPKNPPPPPPPGPSNTGGEESEAKMRERLIERAKRLRKAVTSSVQTGPSPSRDDEKPLQSDGVEESTGIVYPHCEEDGGGVQSGVSEGRGAQDLVKSGYTQIHVSYDRIEPETGESENVAVDVDGGSRGGGGGGGGEGGMEEEQMEEGEVVSSEECGGGPGTPVQDEALTASAGGGDPDSSKSDPVAKKTEPTPVEKAAGHVPTSHESKDSKREKPGGDERQKRDEENREQDKVGAVSDVQAGKNEQVLAADKVGGAKGGERNEDKTGKVQQTLEKHAEEGEILSQSPTPNSRQPKKVSTQRCYMDEEQPSKTKKEKSKQDQHGYDSDHSDRDDRQSSSQRRRSYSYSRSRSRSRDGRYGNRSSKHRRGDGSDYSDYDSRYSDSEKRGRYSSKRRRRDDYSDYSGSDYSDERSSRRYRDNYDSDDNRSSERYSRRSRTDDDRSSRKHRQRSRSRSRSKESRDSGRKSRDKGKKKKKDKKERRHKKDRNDKDDNGQPKVPKKVTVGRVGKLSSLRTLVNKKQEGAEGSEAVGGSGDTPLDKAQATIAESIEERRKQEKQEQERREEDRRLENRIQQHVHGNRTQQPNQQVQPVMTSSVTSPLYPTYPHMSPTDLSQAQHFYPTAYPGYQYPYTAQCWTGNQWATSGSMVAGGDHAQYAQTSGTGEQQYGSTNESGSVEAAVAKEDRGQGKVSSGVTESGSGMAEQESKDTDKTTAAVSSQPPPPAPQSLIDQPTPPQKVETAEESVKPTTAETAATSIPKETVATTAPVASSEDVKQGLPDSFSSDVTVVSSKGEQEPVVSPTKESVVDEGRNVTEADVKEDVSKKEDGDEITECEMEIDSGEGTPIATPAHEGSPDDSISSGFRTNTGELGGEMTTGDANINENLPSVSEAQQQRTLVTKSEDSLSDLKLSSDARDQEPENSPEPLPPGVECEQKTAVTSPPQRQSAKVMESLQLDSKTVENEIAMESDKPAQPGMERESTATLTQKQEVPQKADRPTPPTANQKVAEVKAAVAHPPPATESPQQATDSIPAQPSTPPLPEPTSTPSTTTPAPPTPSSGVSTTPPSSSSGVSTTQPTSSSGVSTTPHEGQVSAAATYYSTPSSSQGYDVVAAAAAYAHATNTGQPYHYPQYSASQTSYDYAAYSAYMQQLGQAGAMYASGYVLGADGQYYAQPNPYAAYAYGGYYPGYTYGTYPTTTQQKVVQPSVPIVSSAMASAAEADKKEKAKKGEFALPDSKEKQMKTMMSKWSSFKDT